MNLAILDDYAGLALESADWSPVTAQATVTVFREPIAPAAAAEVLQPFDILCTLRERTALPRSLLKQLPNLKLITVVGAVANIDAAAAAELGIQVSWCDFDAAAGGPSATPELAWALVLATVRNLAAENRRVRAGDWQGSTGLRLAGRTLGLLGLGRIGRRMAAYGAAFDMRVIAWSQNLTPQAAADGGATYVSRDELFRQSDVLSVHLKLSPRTEGLVTARELALMKPASYLINTARGPIVVEADLIAALMRGAIAGVGLDVFDEEPLPLDHPFRTLQNVTATPHLGYATQERLAQIYAASAAAAADFIAGTLEASVASDRPAREDAVTSEARWAESELTAFLGENGLN